MNSPRFQAPRSGRFYDSLLHAWAGLIHTVEHQRNMRIHLIAATMVGVVGTGIPLQLAEKVTFIFCIQLIFFAEMLNTALEQLVDLAIQEFDDKARLTKDTAAAGVLVLAIGTVVIFAAILVNEWSTLASHIDAIERQVRFGVPFTFCVGALVHERPKPVALDVALFTIGLGLLGLCWSWSESYVFWAMCLGLLIVAGDTARSRQNSRGQKIKNPA